VNAPDVKPPLEYDRSGTGPTRRQFRLLLILTAVNTLLLGWFVAGPQTSQLLKQQWTDWQARRAKKEADRKFLATQQLCLNHTFPPEVVIYDEDPETARQLITERGDYHAMPTSNTPVYGNWPAVALRTAVPREWSAFASAVGTRASGPVLFLGERRKPSGERLLVVVQIEAQPGINVYSGRETRATSEPLRVLQARTFKLSQQGEVSTVGEMSRLRVKTPTAHATLEPSGQWRFKESFALRLFGGQADASDSSHVILPYQLNGQAGSFDLYLHEDGLIFKPQAGVLGVSEGVPTLDLSAPPATAPTTKPS
jgi:hypothetical protein